MNFLYQLLSEDNVIKMITTIIPSLIIAIISPFIVIKIALKQFYTQKWWEAKASAYSKIVESLSGMIYVKEQRFDHDVVNLLNLSEETLKRYQEIESKAYEELRKAKAIGSYIISNDAIETLNLLEKGLNLRDANGDWVKDIDEHLGALYKCMEQIRKIASRDLQKGK
ncbi:hypothetical protein ACQCN2_09460 [Brevibacillus ginsengisoli]|uniref:hypothetical protein n=1 Tax=Brevibacillus ginsengisoli TaxID=363854 RepID=UPI003CF621D6